MPYFKAKSKKKSIFTPGLYSLPTRIGEWNNALSLQESQSNLANYKKENCQQLAVRTKEMMKNVLDPVKLDMAIESLNYGNIYQITTVDGSNIFQKSKKKGLYMSIIMNEIDILHATNFIHGCEVSASPNEAPCRRNCFFFRSIEGKVATVNYGEKLLIQICRKHNETPLYVRAEHDTIDSFGSVQTVRLSSSPDAYCFFKILHWNPTKRIESVDSQVIPNTAVILQHVASGHNLACGMKRWRPTFHGPEASVCCYNYQKSEARKNLWKIIGEEEVMGDKMQGPS